MHLHAGIIDGVTPRCKYAGDFCIVQDVDEDDLYAAYRYECICSRFGILPSSGNEVTVRIRTQSPNSSALDCTEGLTAKTLTDAMRHVGRRLNQDEANRLVKSFDTDGNGTIDFHEFTEGFQVPTT
jgi:hypothetical protein